MGHGIELFFTMAAVVGGPLLALMVVPALAKRFLKAASPREPRSEERPEELDALAHRVAELEERLDFAERMLAQQRDAALPKPRA